MAAGRGGRCRLLAGCATAGGGGAAAGASAPQPARYTPLDRSLSLHLSALSAASPTAITGATIFDGEGGRIDNGTIVLADGRIQAIGGADTPIPEGATRIDGSGRWVTPGVIDIHSHLGDYPSPGVEAHQDGNEVTSPVRPEVWAEHSVWPQDPGLHAARSPMAASPPCTSCPARPTCSAAAA